ncbi:hypothetical protein V8C26DRAFT_413353 [Trichoderma gracile]
MDQPINLPSLFISLRCRCVEIQYNPSRGPKSCETSKVLYPAGISLLSPPLQYYSPMIFSIGPMQRKKKKSRCKIKQELSSVTHKTKTTNEHLLCLRSRQGKQHEKPRKEKRNRNLQRKMK